MSEGEDGNEVLIGMILSDWQRIFRNTVSAFPTLDTGPALSQLGPVLNRLVNTNNLSQSLAEDLRRAAGDSHAQSASGPALLTRLATALAHTQQAGAHFSTVATALTEAHRRPSHRPAAVPGEGHLSGRLAHDAALRSLQRALDAVTLPLDDAQPALKQQKLHEHLPVFDPPPSQPARHRP